MSKIAIHGFAPSTFVRSARMGAIELDLQYELKPVDFGSRSHRALHPFARMPILTDNDVVVYETLAILAYLDERSAAGRLFPSSGPMQWRSLTACSVVLDYGYQAVVHGDDEAATSRASKVLAWAEDWFDDLPFLCGAQLGAADILFAPMLAHRLSKVSADMAFDQRPKLKHWYAEIEARDSFIETTA